jgi:hypothetical protein
LNTCRENYSAKIAPVNENIVFNATDHMAVYRNGPVVAVEHNVIDIVDRDSGSIQHHPDRLLGHPHPVLDAQQSFFLHGRRQSAIVADTCRCMMPVVDTHDSHRIVPRGRKT